ncbi:MAG: isoprenylcysteine carboxylmethyltransferase family protein [Synergistaceae bacterium]|jgi:protein-S-isoprenylcysteine O-methyltransferase Ste14|nr:isoprenylcysteine carboxylmethyltransferase family protein [Synergistaceae bacterium]
MSEKSTLIQRLQEKAFHLRGGVWTLLFFAILLLARPTALSALMGLPLVVLGQAFRFWAVGCIGRYRGEWVGAEALATWGPYAFVRNPLYTGNGFIGLGWGLMAGLWATLAFVVIFVLLYTMLIVPHEEAFLLEKFGDEYRHYKERTGRFFPKGWPGGRIKGSFDTRVLWRSERYSLLTTVVGTFLILARGLM